MTLGLIATAPRSWTYRLDSVRSPLVCYWRVPFDINFQVQRG